MDTTNKPEKEYHVGKYRMHLSKGYLVALRELAHYSLPFLVGWEDLRQATLSRDPEELIYG